MPIHFVVSLVLVKADYPASSSTLTILSKYCGFNSIDEIEKLSSKTTDDDACK